MNESISFFRIITGAIIYVFWAFLIGYFITDLAPYAAVLAAFGAGIYASHKSRIHTGTANGIVAGLIGGIIGGILSSYTPTIAGIPLSVSVSSFLVPTVESIPTATSMFSITALSLIGLVFGGLGGLMGSIKKLRGIFLFITLFLLFIFYGAIDNMIWNWEKTNWTWNMSFSHVLTNQIDLLVAIAFAITVTVLAHTLNLFKNKA